MGDAGRGGDAGHRDLAGRRLRLRRLGPPGHGRRQLDPRPRRRLQPRDRRPQRLPAAVDRGAVDGGDRLRRLPRAAAPPPLLPDDAARRDRHPGLVPGPGPAALRPLLRPDAGPVLLPLRRLGQRPRGRADGIGGNAEDDRLHADRLAADAGRGDRDGDHRRRRRPPNLLDRRTGQAPDRRRQSALDLLVLRRRLPGQDARLPPARLDARRLPSGAAAGPGGLLGSAGQGRRLRLPARRPAALPRGDGPVPDGDPADRPGLDPLRLGNGLHPDQRAPDRRLLLGGPARLHHRRHLRLERRWRGRSGPADGQPRPRRRTALRNRRHPRRALWDRGPPRDGRHGNEGPGPRRPLPSSHTRNPRDARLCQLHRRVLHPQRPLRLEDRLRLRRYLGCRHVGVLRVEALPEDHAQPAARRARIARDQLARRDRPSAAGALHPRPGALPAVDPQADR